MDHPTYADTLRTNISDVTRLLDAITATVDDVGLVNAQSLANAVPGLLRERRDAARALDLKDANRAAQEGN